MGRATSLDDETAKKYAQRLVDDRDVDLWQPDRKVESFKFPAPLRATARRRMLHQRGNEGGPTWHQSQAHVTKNALGVVLG
jgi:hypothetical protein